MSTHENLLKDLRLSEPSSFQNFLRLDATSFDELLRMITPRIEKNECYYAECYSFKPALCQLHCVTLLQEILLKT